jgi:hypothetical protein
VLSLSAEGCKGEVAKDTEPLSVERGFSGRGMDVDEVHGAAPSFKEKHFTVSLDAV